MRRFLLTTITLMMTVCMMAVGLNDGSAKANAVDFRWGEGHDHQAGTTSWYRVDLDSISGLVDPTLALYLTNLSDQPSKVTVDVSATISVSTPFFSYNVDTAIVKDQSYTIAARDYKLLSQNVKMLLEMNVRYLYLELHSEQTIKLSAKKYETSDIVDDACTKSQDFDWTGEDVPVGETWYRLNLAEVKSLNQELDFVVTNTAATQAQVKFELSLDCPASTIWGYNWSIPAGSDMTEEFGRVFIDELNDDYVYLKLTTDQPLELKVAEKPAPPVLDEWWTVDEKLTEGQSYTISGETVFEIDLATLSAPRGMKAEFVVTNNTNADDTLAQSLSFANPVKNTIEKRLPVAANSSVTMEVVNNMAGLINSNKVFVRFVTNGELTIQLNYVVVNDEVVNAKPVVLPTCENSELLDWNSVVKQKGLETKWYEIDLASIKQNDQHLQLSFTNKSKNLVVVMGDILPTCKSKDTIPYVLPVQPGQTLSQVINYNLFALLPHPEHFYVSAMVIPTTATSIMELAGVRSMDDIMAMVPKDIETIQAAEVELVAKTFTALADPTDCNQAVTIARGVKYEQQAGTTQWYRVTDELLNQLSISPDIAFINNGKATAHITMAAGVDCQHSTFALTGVSVPTWGDLTFFPSRLLGNILDKVFNRDVTEMYLQVTTDQPIAFGIDIDYGFGLGCDDAREFNWETGATIMPGDAQWLSFDITSVKQNEQQIKLTLTNESNSLAWVAMLTSLTCPFDVAMPMVFPIPAGMSVDKVVDYSYFAATKLDQLYVALITEEKVSVKAVAESAQANPADKNACANAITVETGVKYVHQPGTTWYEFGAALFDNMNKYPMFNFATPQGRTRLTIGATVDCQYNIATRATLPVPGNMNLSLRIPRFVFDVIRKFVHQDVQTVFVEMTTDKQVEFSIDMAYVDACETATKLDFSQPVVLDLQANQEVWYEVDVKELFAMTDKQITYSVTNSSDQPVEVQAIISPTCPVIASHTEVRTIGANSTKSGSISVAAIQKLYNDFISTNPVFDKLQGNRVYYVCVRANGDLSVDTETDTIPEKVEGCEAAIELDWTKTINLSDLNTGWYKLNLTNVHASKQDVTLTFNNDSNVVIQVGLEVYEDCDAPMMAGMTYNLPVGLTTKAIDYATVNKMIGEAPEMYVYLTINGEVVPVEACMEAVDYVLGTTIELQPNTDAWYKIDITEAKKNADDLIFTAHNVSNDTVKVTLEMAYECPVTSYELQIKDKVILPLATVTQRLDADYFVDIDVDTVYLHVFATGALTVTVTPDTVTPQKQYAYETIMTYHCTDDLPAILTWNDTVNVSSTLDSVYTYIAKPLVAPVALTKDELVTALGGSTPTIVPGVTPDLSATVAAIKAHYTSLDDETVADVVVVTWENTTAVPCGADKCPVTLVIEDECGNKVTTTYDFDVTVEPVKTIEQTVTICPSELPYSWENMSFDMAGDYTNTLTNIHGCDSAILILHLNVFAEIAHDTIETQICPGETYFWNNNPYNVTGCYTDTLRSPNGCDSVVTLHLTVLPELVEQHDSVTICLGDSYYWPVNGLTYPGRRVGTADYEEDIIKSSLGCDSVKPYLHLTVLARTVHLKTINDYACDGTEYVDPITNEKHIISSLIPSTQTWNDTVAVSQCEDSVYTYVITPIVAPEVMTDATLASIAVDPVLTQGVLPDMNGTVAAIMAYYNGNDTEAIADVNNIYWTDASLNNVVPCGATTHTMTLVVEAGCDNKITTTHTFDVLPVIGTETIVECDSYTWNGQTYTASGDYTFTTQTAAGCDSIATLHLTINKSFFHEETVKACDSYTWAVDGKTYSDSGDYTFTGQTAAGCDSTYVLHLTINKSFYHEDIQVACDSYDWFGMTLTKSGLYTHTVNPDAGCDSTYVLHLTINKTVYTEETVTACDSYDWNGQTYDKSDDYVYTTTAANGCDSVVTLHLTINKSFYKEETAVACDSYTWDIDGKTYSDSGDKYFNGKTAAGCDSTYVLHLTINKSFFHEETVKACDSYTWDVDGQTYFDSGDKYFNGKTAAGCDSTYVLHLTINKSFYKEETAAACVSYTWAVDSKTYTTSGDYTFNGQTATGCDSTYVLHLTILPDVVYEPTETDYFCPASTHEWRNHTYDAPGTYYDTVYNVLGCDSIIYTLELLQYVNTIPTITPDDIIAICGNAIDVTLADAVVNAHIASEALYAPNAKIEWYILSGNDYTEMTNTAIDGTITEVTVKYAVVTDCGIVESDPVTVTVETPTPENDSEMANISALSKYGDRLLLINLKHIEETFGWNVAEEDVTWYYVVDDLDNYADETALKNDIVLGHGYYYNENSGMPVPAGQYYARIAHEAAFESDCDGVLQTEVITCATSKAAPMLVPNIVKPQELIRLINLEPSEVISISVYSSTGENLGTYQVNSSEDMTFNAAQQAGFYLVDVNTESGKVSLRYIVK